jgi:hypothetical protein
LAPECFANSQVNGVAGRQECSRGVWTVQMARPSADATLLLRTDNQYWAEKLSCTSVRRRDRRKREVIEGNAAKRQAVHEKEVVMHAKFDILHPAHHLRSIALLHSMAEREAPAKRILATPLARHHARLCQAPGLARKVVGVRTRRGHRRPRGLPA